MEKQAEFRDDRDVQTQAEDDDRDDAVIAADDTGMISNERAIVHEDIEDASEP